MQPDRKILEWQKPVYFENGGFRMNEVGGAVSALTDMFGRTVKNLRISVTDRCNLRCHYCMPNLKIKFMDKSRLLTFEEIYRIARIFVKLGVETIRLTGGEPLVRNDVLTLVRMLNDLRDLGLKKLKMTTNGMLLEKFAYTLAENGINQINISLDTLNAEKFKRITQLGDFDTVFAGIMAALDTKMKVKINAVAIRGFNDSEIFDFIKFSAKYDVTVRFIELMPFSGNFWDRDRFISKAELLQRIQQKYDVVPLPQEDPSQTSTVYKVEPIGGKIGFIASVTESFCSTCNRLRLTAEGFLRPCLHSSIEVSLRDHLRNGATDEQLIDIIREIVMKKPQAHEDFLHPLYVKPQKDRPMIKIGG